MYPSDAAGIQQLADDLLVAGFKPTQPASRMNKAKIDRMADDMANGAFDWSKFKPWEKVIVAPGGEILDGHHRVIASVVSGMPLPADQVIYFRGANLRPVYDWIDVLPT
jgi:hypothetical protein